MTGIAAQWCGTAPPDFVRDMERLAGNQAILREKLQQIVRERESRRRRRPM